MEEVLGRDYREEGGSEGGRGRKLRVNREGSEVPGSEE